MNLNQLDDKRMRLFEDMQTMYNRVNEYKRKLDKACKAYDRVVGLILRAEHDRIKSANKPIVTGLIDGEYADEHLNRKPASKPVSYHVRIHWNKGCYTGMNLVHSESMTKSKASKLAKMLNSECSPACAYSYYVEKD